MMFDDTKLRLIVGGSDVKGRRAGWPPEHYVQIINGQVVFTPQSQASLLFDLESTLANDWEVTNFSKGEPVESEPKKEVPAVHEPLPVAGYTPQSEVNIALANRLKEAEERYLRILDDLTDSRPQCPFDQRFIALARTHMQTANMFAVRAIFKPQRIALPEDSKA